MAIFELRTPVYYIPVPLLMVQQVFVWKDHIIKGKNLHFIEGTDHPYCLDSMSGLDSEGCKLCLVIIRSILLWIIQSESFYGLHCLYQDLNHGNQHKMPIFHWCLDRYYLSISCKNMPLSSDTCEWVKLSSEKIPSATDHHALRCWSVSECSSCWVWCLDEKGRVPWL